MKLGSPLNETDNKNWTCLLWAAWAGHEQIARRLLQLGSSTSCLDLKQWFGSALAR